MRQVIDEFVLVPRGEAAERINGTMILSETAAFIYEHLEEAIKVRDKKANTVNEQDNPLGYEKESKLLVGFAIPCIISMLVTALYNIVDQIFIGQGVGMLGNAATNIAFPLSTSCTAISLLRQCDQFFIEAWCRRRKRICRVCGKWNLPDGNFRDCTFCSNDDFSDSDAEILRCHIGGTSVCTGIYTDHGNWLSISDRKYGDE